MTSAPEQISVAILTYNRSKTAIRSICSVAHNSDKYVEIFVFDDGSNYEDLKNIKQCIEQLPNVTLFESPQNCGYAKNLVRALSFLAERQSIFSFICESDMLLSPGWASRVRHAFYYSPESVALSGMLHKDQLTSLRSERFRCRCLYGEVIKSSTGQIVEEKQPFGSCYTELPNKQAPIKLPGFKIRYISNTVGTIVFRSSFLDSILDRIEEVYNYKFQEDAWLSWYCFTGNRYSPKSLMVLDPGIALTFGEEGLHGPMQFANLRWSGSIFWRYPIISWISSYVCLLRWFFKQDAARKAALIQKKLHHFWATACQLLDRTN